MESPYNGERSILYQDSLDYTKDEQVATDVWAAASTPDFQEQVYGPKVQEHKDRLYRQLEGFSPAVQPLTPVEYAGGDRVYTLREDGNKLGQIRTTPYRNGHRIVTSNISGQQGQGVGSRLYRGVIEHSLNNGLDLYSDTNLSPSAEGMWGRLKRFGIATQDNVVPATPFDQNREPRLSEVLDFIEAQSPSSGLDQEQQVELKIALTGTAYNSSDELYSALNRAFYPNGVFAPTRESLRATGLYTNAEAANIMSDQELQQDIKDLIERLKNTEEPIYNDIPVDPAYMATSQLGINILGKMIMDNPYINEKEALELLGGIKNREEYEDTLYDSNLDYLKGQGDMFPDFSSYDRAREMEIGPNGNLVQRTSYTKEILRETMKVPENNGLMSNILYLESVDDIIWEDSPQEVKEILAQIREDASDIAVDLDGLEQAYNDMSRAEVIGLLNSIAEYLVAPTEGNLDSLSQALDTYHSTDISPKERVVKVQPQSRGEALMYLDTKERPYSLFANYGLLPLGNNVYQAVRNNDNLDLMYDNLYLNVLDNPQILPETAYRTALEQDGSLNRSALNRPANRDRIIQDIKNFVQGQTKLIEDATDMEMAQRMYISSVYFNTKLDNTGPIPTMENEIANIEEPVPNGQYLATEFISDFRVQQIKEKQKGSDRYDNFRVTQRGLEFINDDPISMARTNLNLTTDMENYMRLHKYSFQILGEPTDRITDRTLQRNYYTNYPEALPKFTRNHTTISNRVLATKTTEAFIKVNGRVYEAAKGTGEYTFYSQLDVNPSDYKIYDTNMPMPELDVDVSNYGSSTNQQETVETKTFYNTQQEQEIDERIECS